MIKPSDRETYRVAVDIDSLLLLLLLHQPYYALNKFVCIYIYRTIYIYKTYKCICTERWAKNRTDHTDANLSSSPYSSPLLSENLRLRLRRKSKRENLFIILIFPGGGRGRDKRLWASIKTARKWNNSKIIITDLLGTTALYVPMLRTTATYSYIRTYHNSSFIVAKWYFFGTHTL